MQRHHKAIPLITRRVLGENAGTLTLRDGSTAMPPIIVPAFECLTVIPEHRYVVYRFLSSTPTGIEEHCRSVYGRNSTEISFYGRRECLE